MTDQPQDPPHRPFFDALVQDATDAFEGGALTFALPRRAERDLTVWDAEQVRLYRLLVCSPTHDENGRRCMGGWGTPLTQEQKRMPPAHVMQAYRVWATPLAELLRDVRAPRVWGPADFQLTTDVVGRTFRVTSYAVLPVTERVGVLTVERVVGAGDTFPVPVVLVDRWRLLPAVARVLWSLIDWPDDLTGWSASCTHSAPDLYRVILGSSGYGSGVWDMPVAELARFTAEHLHWGLAELKEGLDRGSDYHHLTPRRHPDEQVGWLCSRRGGDLRIVLCVQCGADDRLRIEPVYMDSVRPQPQSCALCGARLVEGILGDLPERYPS